MSSSLFQTLSFVYWASFGLDFIKNDVKSTSATPKTKLTLLGWSRVLITKKFLGNIIKDFKGKPLEYRAKNLDYFCSITENLYYYAIGQEANSERLSSSG